MQDLGPPPDTVLPGRRTAASPESIFQRPAFMDSGPRPSGDPAMTSFGTEGRPKLLFLVTEDWYFWSHRLPVARAARDAAFDVIVAARVQAHGERIRAKGFRLHPLAWRRRGGGVFGAARAIIDIARLYRAERPDIVHHVALKPVLFGALAGRLAFPSGRGMPARLSAVMGLGGGFGAQGALARIERSLLGWALR